jgi:hypothetical protein
MTPRRKALAGRKKSPAKNGKKWLHLPARQIYFDREMNRLVTFDACVASSLNNLCVSSTICVALNYLCVASNYLCGIVLARTCIRNVQTSCKWPELWFECFMWSKPVNMWSEPVNLWIMV